MLLKSPLNFLCLHCTYESTAIGSHKIFMIKTVKALVTIYMYNQPCEHLPGLEILLIDLKAIFHDIESLTESFITSERIFFKKINKI